MPTRITAYGNLARTAGKGIIGIMHPADAMRTLKKSSSFRASLAPYLTPWYAQKNLQDNVRGDVLLLSTYDASNPYIWQKLTAYCTDSTCRVTQATGAIRNNGTSFDMWTERWSAKTHVVGLEIKLERALRIYQPWHRLTSLLRYPRRD